MRPIFLASACILFAACGPRYTNQTVEAAARYGNPNTEVYYTMLVDPAGLATRTKTQGGEAEQPVSRQIAPASFTLFKRTVVEADPMSMKASYDPCATAKCTGLNSSFELRVTIDGKTKAVTSKIVDNAGNPQGLKDIMSAFLDLDDTFKTPDDV